MISKKEASELIFAGVLGCLDRADQTKLNEYMKSGGELPNDVGEFQNIAAMLPIILKAETPGHQLKNKVARKLYRIKDEIRAKVSDDTGNAGEVFYRNARGNKKPFTLEEKITTSEPEKFRIEDKKSSPEIKEYRKVPTSEIIEENLKEENLRNEIVNEEKPAEEEPEEEKSEKQEQSEVKPEHQEQVEEFPEEQIPEEIQEEAEQVENIQAEEIQEEEKPKEEVKQEPEIKEELKPKDFEPVTSSRNTFESFKSTREKVLEGNFEEALKGNKPLTEEDVKPEIKIPTREKIKTYERVVTKDKIPNKTATRESQFYQKTSTKDRAKSFEKAYKKKRATQEYSKGRKSGIQPWAIITFFVILILAIAVLYLNFSSEMTDLKFTNESLKQEVNDLTVKFNSTQEIQSLMESVDVRIVNLDGTGINPVGKGKLIISRSQSKGYLQLSDMPALGQDRAYQLWMQLPVGGYFSLGVFNPAGRVQYFPFQLPQSEGNTSTDFVVTEESSSGASKPGNKVFLKGSL